MSPLVLVGIFVVSAAVGYKLIGNVPSLLHTPLMSGMNALSGITVLGGIIAAAAAVYTGSRVMLYAALVLAMINIACGFGVTHRMLMMFRRKE